jgi:hypothetical protein
MTVQNISKYYNFNNLIDLTQNDMRYEHSNYTANKIIYSLNQGENIMFYKKQSIKS